MKNLQEAYRYDEYYDIRGIVEESLMPFTINQ